MEAQTIAQSRLASQQVSEHNFGNVIEIVAHLGAMQAQDLAMAKLAIGLRLRGSIEIDIDAALNRGALIRTHVMRPTWHVVSADDLQWLIDLTAPQIIAAQKTRHRQLELTDKIFQKSFRVLEEAFSDKDSLTRKEIAILLKQEKIPTEEQRLSHILFMAELNALICSGPIKEKHTSYALVEKRVKKAHSISRDEALCKLAERYFIGHAPATLADFVWWSALTSKEAKRAVEISGKRFMTLNVGERQYIVPLTFKPTKGESGRIYFLPAFDEFIIGYTDRTTALSTTDFGKVISNNGIFRPVIVANGQVIGIWQRIFKKGQLNISAQFFQKPDNSVLAACSAAAEKIGEFYSQKTEFSWKLNSA